MIRNPRPAANHGERRYRRRRGARFFNPADGIAEGPAPGTAAGRPVVIAQRYATGRPSRIRVDVEPTRVRVSGTAVVAGTGTIAIP
ncbi:hypothetical protein GCM10025864_12340 [Luteimicrobium album]|uniref:PhzF family phenazine biosynthesis protein n=1 Tax=Luteimicrobium album TaxID=1054550 RepID=A0ABQ6I118_9MICO|nr:hypothetical protein GCM10025864_12340 [Luteimicrobium album]